MLRHKHTTEKKFPRYFQFGSNPYLPDTVDVANDYDDTVASVHAEHADKLIANHDAAVDAIESLAEALFRLDPETFETVWGSLPGQYPQPNGDRENCND